MKGCVQIDDSLNFVVRFLNGIQIEVRLGLSLTTPSRGGIYCETATTDRKVLVVVSSSCVEVLEA